MFVNEQAAFRAEDFLQGGRIEDLPRRSLAVNLSVLQAHHMMNMLADHRHVMGNQQDGCASFAIQPANQIVELFLVLKVDARRRFIQQQ